MRRLLILFLLLFALPATAGLFDSRPSAAFGELNNSGDFLPVREAFRLSLVESTPQALRLRLVAAPGYYLYRHRLRFLSEPATVGLGEARLPAGERKTDEYFGDVEVYHGILDIELPLDNPERRPFELQVTYQGCADQGLCYPPETEQLAIDAMPDIPASPPPQPASRVPDAASTAAGAWDWQALALFFLAGLGLSLTPCVLPMLPILAGIVLRGEIGGARGLVLSLAYVLPMAACFALLGALMGLFGAELNLQARLQSPWVLVPFAAFFGLFALAMFGVYELRLPTFVRVPLDRLAGSTRGGSILGAAVLGVLSSLLVSPCVSAPLAGALLYISSSGDALGGGLRLFALGLGMGAPLVLFGAGGGALLPKSGPWMLAVRNAFGVLLLAVALWMLDRVLPGPLTLALWGLLAAGTALFLGTLEFTAKSHRQKLGQLLGLLLLVYALSCWTGALRGESDPLRPLGTPVAVGTVATQPTGAWQTIDSPAALDAALQKARTAGRPLLLDWYADWCISCKVIEREVFSTPEVAAHLGDFQLIRFDITASTPAQRTLLDRYRLFGPPAIQFFDRAGQEQERLRVVGEIDATAFAKRIQESLSQSAASKTDKK